MKNPALAACEEAAITLTLSVDGVHFSAGPASALTPELRVLITRHRDAVLNYLRVLTHQAPIPEPDDDEPAAELWHPAVALTRIKQLATEIRTWRAVGGALAHSLGSTIARMAGEGFERQDMQWIRAAGAMLEDARGFWRDVIWPDVGTVKELQDGLLATPSANAGELPIEGPSHYKFDDSGDEGEAA